MDIVISDAAVGHTLVEIVVADPTRRDLVERAARQDLVSCYITSCMVHTCNHRLITIFVTCVLSIRVNIM